MTPNPKPETGETVTARSVVDEIEREYRCGHDEVIAQRLTSGTWLLSDRCWRCRFRKRSRTREHSGGRYVVYR